MKISIITVCLNSEKTIRDTINSVLSQSYKNIEHIFVDGGSTDKTLDLLKRNPNKNKKIFLKRNSSIYEAMNFGIKKSSGNIIQILNSDDVLENSRIIDEVIKKVKKFPDINIFLGNVVFFSNNKFDLIKRYFVADKDKINNIRNGEMPPHPSSFIKKETYKKFGLYKTNLKIASDFDYFSRILLKNKQKYKLLNKNVVRMRAGGVSDRFFKSYLVCSKEIILSLRQSQIKFNKIKIYLRFIKKIKELISWNQKSLNKNYEIFKFIFDKRFYDKRTIKIIRNTNSINFNKQFILSGLNLAFMGFLTRGDVYLSKKLYHWPDGIYAKKFVDLKKISGFKLLNKLILPKDIKHIHVIGNLSNLGKKYLSRYKKNIVHTHLNYGEEDNMSFKFNKSLKNTLILLTLPTPKQEIIAERIAKNNSQYKIICIGGAISIASGEIPAVPVQFEQYEYIWRLRNDTFRRLKRVITSFFYFQKGLINKKFDNLIFKISDK
jgi:glycosyltransferase involved in cell wall biosynthesis